MDDAHPWRSAVVIGLIAIVAGMVVSTIVPLVLGRGGWWIPGDAWTTLRASHYIPQGAFPLIYETGTKHDVFDSGPLLPLLLAPIAAIGDFFHLQESYPFPRPYPNMWLVFGPYALASAIPLLYAVRALATQLGVRSGRVALQWCVLIFAFVPMAIVYGHYEDVIALALLLLAFRDLFAGRGLRGAVLVGVAIAFKQWSVLAVPVYVAACPASLRFRVALRGVVPPGVFLGAFLALDYRYASEALLHPPAFVEFGHSALWVAPHAELMTHVPQRAGALLVALAGGWLVRRRPDPVRVLSALGCVLLARYLFEPAVHAYYLSPGLAVLILVAWTRGRGLMTNVTVGATLLLVFPLHPSRWLWWAVVYALTAVVLYEPAARIALAPPGRSEDFAAIRTVDTGRLVR
jgi:hypothetical protein